MMKKITFMIPAFCLFASIFYNLPACGADAYRIILKNGETIVARHYEIQGDNIVLYKLGGSFAFNRSEVVKIEKESGEAVSTPNDSEQTEKGKTSATSKQKGSSSKDPGETELAKCQRILKLNQNSMEIQCYQAASARITAAPDVPRANQTTVSEKTAKQFQEHVQSKVSAFKAGSACDYYKRKVAELEKKCRELE